MGEEIQNMSAEEVKNILEQRKSKNDDLSPREAEELLEKCAKDTEQQMAINAERAAAEERQGNVNEGTYPWGLEARLKRGGRLSVPRR